MTTNAQTLSIAERIADQALALDVNAIPAAVRTRVEELLIDVVGLCVAARNTDYIKALLAGVDSGGPATAIGHKTTYAPETAAMINGCAAHGEDFDDTFEGGPVHSCAVIMPAILATCERFGCDGKAAFKGMVAGIETLCRLSMVIPKAIHKSATAPNVGWICHK